jgi:hypothetical protein
MKSRLSLLLVILTIVACNPVKRAFKEKYIDQTKEEFFRRKLCVADTIIDTLIVTDTVKSVDTLYEIKFVNLKLKDVVLDTTIDKVRLVINKGSIFISCPKKLETIYKTKTIVKQVRDKSYESVLEKDIKFKDSTIKAQALQIKSLELDKRSLKLTNWLLIISILAYIGFRIKRAFF